MRIALRFDGPNGPGALERDQYEEVDLVGSYRELPECVQRGASIYVLTHATYNGFRVYRRVQPALIRST